MNRERIELSLDNVSPSVIIIDEGDPRFEIVTYSIQDYDYRFNGISVAMRAIIKRKEDGKLFSLDYIEEEDSTTWPEEMVEVFETQKLRTVYE